jgi:HPt (histidine-containing phosphotransfer) domain-containing protein
VSVRVLWRDAQGKEGSLTLGPQESLIGRGLECAIRTDDAMVSRRHARIIARGSAYVVEDLGSANGIFFQEQRVPEHTFTNGDAVRCGSLWLRFVDTQPVAAAPSPVAQPSHVAPPNPAQPSPHAYAPEARNRAHEAEQAPAQNAREVQRLHRRVEQLQAELRVYRGGGDGARTIEDLEVEIENIARERDEVRRRVRELEDILAEESADAKVIRAGAIAQTAVEIVAGLNDVLSNLRINVMAAEGEFDQFHSALPRASFELIREALRSSAQDMETARDMLRKPRKIAGVT